MCTPGGAAATAKGIGTIGDGHSENYERQVGRLWGFIAFFCLHCIQLVELKPLHCRLIAFDVLCSTNGDFTFK